MRRFPPPRSDARYASPLLPGAKNSRARLSPRGKPHRSRPLAANGAARCAAAPGCAPKSPPSVRGKGRGLDGHALGIRIAPAHAGNACSDGLFLFLDRITPAYAGKKSPAPGRKPVAAEHPAHAGNCPVLRNPGRNAAPRITPARAGKRRPSHVYSQPFWDHPCLCTGKICYEAPEDEKNGSPPHMRGKAVHKGLYRPALRITPAHAGKSAGTFPARLLRTDHPRVCGEKLEAYHHV